MICGGQRYAPADGVFPTQRFQHVLSRNALPRSLPEQNKSIDIDQGMAKDLTQLDLVTSAVCSLAISNLSGCL